MTASNEEYYADLTEKMNRLKNKNDQRSVKKEISYIEKEGNRRSKLSSRGDSLILAAMEVEVQTHAPLMSKLSLKMERIPKFIEVWDFPLLTYYVLHLHLSLQLHLSVFHLPLQFCRPHPTSRGSYK